MYPLTRKNYFPILHDRAGIAMHPSNNEGLILRLILIGNLNTVQIADFGLSRDLQNEDYYVSHGGKIPVKWTAPEALNYRKYSTASDMWSYGVLLYEIWGMGIKPFQDCTNSEVGLVNLIEWPGFIGSD